MTDSINFMADNTTDIDKILKERNSNYGDYSGALIFRKKLIGLIKQRYEDVNNKDISEDDLILFNDIIHKLSRLSVSPRHIDSWVDIQGYSKLIQNFLKEK